MRNAKRRDHDKRGGDSRGCLRKRRYSERMAWDVVKRARKYGDTSMHAYHCTFCAGWHVGFNRTGQ